MSSSIGLELLREPFLRCYRDDPPIVLELINGSFTSFHTTSSNINHKSLADQGSRLFRFDIQNFRNVTSSGVNAPPHEGNAPLREILDPPLQIILNEGGF